MELERAVGDTTPPITSKTAKNQEEPFPLSPAISIGGGSGSTAVELRWTRCAPWLLPLPAERGEGWAEGNPLGLARSSSPLPSPPLAGGEGEAAAPSAGTSLIQRQWANGGPAAVADRGAVRRPAAVRSIAPNHPCQLAQFAARTWLVPRMYLACTWLAPGLHLACTWLVPGLYLALGGFLHSTFCLRPVVAAPTARKRPARGAHRPMPPGNMTISLANLYVR
jgi:hypothetical protein